MNIDAVLQPLRKLSDEALWGIAKSRIAPEINERIQTLLDMDSRTTEAQSELDTLLHEADLFTLRKAEAVVLLRNRGYDV